MKPIQEYEEDEDAFVDVSQEEGGWPVRILFPTIFGLTHAKFPSHPMILPMHRPKSWRDRRSALKSLSLSQTDRVVKEHPVSPFV